MNITKIKSKTGIAAIYVLALLLVGFGYWNYVSVESQNLQTVADTQSENNSDENLGDAQLVNSNDVVTSDENNSNSADISSSGIAKGSTGTSATTSSTQNTVINTNGTASTEKANTSDNYFEESKLQRDTMYSQTLETYKEMLNNSNVSEEQKSIITQEITNLNKEKNAIMVCENLITTKGFSNSVIFVNTDSVSVVIESDELKTDEIAQIQNIISREMGAKTENIHIMTKN